MKKVALILAAALLVLVIGAAALTNDTALELYQKTEELLFSTDNVTLKAKVDFNLDSAWFKTAEITLMQDGTRAFRQLDLKSPKADGTERKNGYTIVTAGDKIYLMEVYTPGVYRTGNNAERNSILRSTVETGVLRTLGEALASQADLLLGEGAVTRTEDGAMLLKLDDNPPAMVNAALNEMMRFAAKRWFSMDYDRIRTDDALSMYSFGTITEGLLYATQTVSLREAEIMARQDENGDLQSAEGKLNLYIQTAADGIHQLDISFSADISGRGTTMVKKFDPADYNVVEDHSAEVVIGYEYGTEIFPESVPEEGIQGVSADLFDEMMVRAMEIWQKTGYNMVNTTEVGCRLAGNVYDVMLRGRDLIEKHTYFTAEGSFIGIEADSKLWQNVNVEQYQYDTAPEAELDRKAKEKLMDFLKFANPELLDIVKELKAEWTYETDGVLFAQYTEYPLEQETDGVLFVVRVSPEMKIEYYSCVSNG